MGVLNLTLKFVTVVSCLSVFGVTQAWSDPSTSLLNSYKKVKRDRDEAEYKAKTLKEAEEKHPGKFLDNLNADIQSFETRGGNGVMAEAYGNVHGMADRMIKARGRSSDRQGSLFDAVRNAYIARFKKLKAALDLEAKGRGAEELENIRLRDFSKSRPGKVGILRGIREELRLIEVALGSEDNFLKADAPIIKRDWASARGSVRKGDYMFRRPSGVTDAEKARAAEEGKEGDVVFEGPAPTAEDL